VTGSKQRRIKGKNGLNANQQDVEGIEVSLLSSSLLFSFPPLIPHPLDGVLEVFYARARVVPGRVERLMPQELGQADEIVLV
jgi:hypothetical protein